MPKRAARSRWVWALVAVPLIAWSCAPGALDPRFGRAGRVTTDFRDSNEAAAIARQPDGKIIAVGYTNAAVGTDFALARYLRNGSLDRTFGAGGRVTTDQSPAFDFANAVVLQPDGKIVIAGTGLARYDSTGALDPGFGSGGTVGFDFTWSLRGASAIALQPDGKIVVAGGVVSGGDRVVFGVARYLPNGSIDTGFGDGGLATSDFGTRSADASTVAVQRDGRIVAVGYASPGLARAGFTSSGVLDPAFGVGGKIVTTFSDPMTIPYAMALRGDDSFVVVGGWRSSASGAIDVFVSRYRADGALDETFGSDGAVTTSFGVPAEGRAVALTRTGEIVVAASSPYSTTSDDFLLARYRSDGEPDRSFGEHGRVITDFGAGPDHAHGVVIAPDGTILVGGSATPAGQVLEDFGLARYFGRRWVFPLRSHHAPPCSGGSCSFRSADPSR